MIITRSNTEKLDSWIYHFQIMEQRKLAIELGISGTENPDTPTSFANCLYYGRCEINNEKNIVHIVGTKDYLSLGMEDMRQLVTYIVLVEQQIVNFKDKYICSLYCHANLDLIYPSATERKDQELKNTVLDLVKKFVSPSNLSGVEMIEEMQPLLSFKINFTV